MSMPIVKPLISRRQALLYEVSSSWWARYVRGRWQGDLALKYFQWKVNRKYDRYLCAWPKKDGVA
jgi:hypothetical protein